MYVPLMIKTDYSLLTSLIKINSLNNVSPCLGIVDDNLGYVMEFYNFCQKNSIKPIIGLDINYNNTHLYLYAQNNKGYHNLIKINNIKNEREISENDFSLYGDNTIALISFKDIDLFKKISQYFITYIAYKDDEEKKNALLITNNIVYAKLVLCLNKTDESYLKYLDGIKNLKPITELEDLDDVYLIKEIAKSDEDVTFNFASLFNLELDFSKNYIPAIPNSSAKLSALIKKGLSKRLDDNIPDIYINRIKYEFSVIKEMGFTDYFLIVYDYVLHAKKKGILVGPGRGSAAGSLVSYALGITDVDPIKYNLLFERFLNKERITMPDIDLDFEFDRREEVINYIREKYGNDYVALIMTYGTLGSKQVVRDVARTLELDDSLTDKLARLINPQISLKDNLNNKELKSFITHNELEKLYKISLKLEGLKRHVSTHAAGIIISNDPLNNIIPLTISGGIQLTGFTMEYLEQIGLIKMDILALKNLTIISNVKKLVKASINEEINLNEIHLNDQKTLNLFYTVDTVGIFQFESRGMMNFLNKLKVSSFIDLVNAVALFRPGPMENIDSFIKRREGKEKIDYIDSSLEPILKDTYGIIVYQEQVMQILNKMASYSYAEADIVRRAMSKKKKDVLENEKKHFISNALKNGYKESVALKTFDYILKFANYGFNKAHSVSYALLGYQMAYLKSNYRVSFITNLLNMSLGSEIKTKEYIDEAKKHDIKVIKPSINLSDNTYKVDNLNIIMPFTSIKNIGVSASNAIISERENGYYKSFLDFMARIYKCVNKKAVESLINSGCFESFNLNHQTIINNLDNIIIYAELIHDLDESLVEKPIIEEYEEYSKNILMQNEIDSFGFYISNHPASKYQKNIIKSNNLISYFNKNIKTIIMIDTLSKIKTKNGEEMAFVDGSDEYGKISCVIFPKKVNLLKDLSKGDLVKIIGQVTKRFDKYQIVVSNIEKAID